MAKDCVFCAFKYVFIYFRVVGIYSHNYVCQHTRNGNKVHIEFVKTDAIISLLIAFTMIISVLIDHQNMLQEPFNMYHLIRTFTNNVSLFTTGIIIIMLVSGSNIRVQVFLGLQAILNEARAFGVENIITVKINHILQLGTLLYSWSFLLILVFYIFYIFHTLDDGYLIFRALLTLFCLYLDFGLLCAIFLEAFMYKLVLMRCHAYIRNILLERRDFIHLNKLNKIYGKLSLYRIRKLIRLTYAVKVNLVNLYAKLLNPSALVWLFNMVIVSTFDVFLLCDAIIRQQMDLLGLQYFLLDFRIYISEILILVTLITVDEFTNAVSKFAFVYLFLVTL